MWIFLVLLSFICTAAEGAATTVTGHRGHRLDIRCPYEPGYKTNTKYFCKGECNIGNKNILVESGSPSKDKRFSLNDNRAARVFTVTITDLRTEDEGIYWCAVRRMKPLTDLYSEILLLVKQDDKTTEVSTVRPFSNTPSSALNLQSTSITPRAQPSSSSGLNLQSNSNTVQSHPKTDSVIFICVGLILVLLGLLMVLMVLYMQKRGRKTSPRVTPSPSEHISTVLLNIRPDTTAEDDFSNDQIYQEIIEHQSKTDHDTPAVSTIYSTAETPADSMIYSTAETPAVSTIYSTTETPADSMIYSTAETPDVSTIYSTAETPDVSTIYSTAETPADSMITQD